MRARPHLLSQELNHESDNIFYFDTDTLYVLSQELNHESDNIMAQNYGTDVELSQELNHESDNIQPIYGQWADAVISGAQSRI